MKKITYLLMGLLLCAFSWQSSAQCDYTLEMTDSWGDGWNNGGPTSANTMDVLVNGVVVLDDVYVDSVPLATETFTVNTGDDITVVWTGGGSGPPNYEGECSYRILDTAGVEVAAVNPIADGSGDITAGTLPAAFCPSCLAPTAITSSSVGPNPTISWTDPNTSAGTYEYYIVEQGDPVLFTGTAIATTAVTLTLDPFTIYDFYARTSCDGGTSFTPWSGAFEYNTGYCFPGGVTGTGPPNFLDNVVTSGGPGTVTENINNTGTGLTPGGYTDYTAIQAIRGVFENSSFDVDLSGDSAGFFAYYTIWIDWNNDLVFDPVTELVYDSGQVFPAAAIATITVPLATPVGSYRMRIVQDLIPGPGPCNGNNFAEYEDYTIETVAAPACLPPTAITSSSTGPNPTISWTDSNVPAATYEYYIVEQGDPVLFTGTAIATASVTLTLSPFTIYDFYVRSSCDGGVTFTVWSGPFEYNTGYCLPGNNNGTEPAFLDNVVTSGGPGTVTENINNTGTGLTPGGYTDYTATQAIRGVYESSSFDVDLSGDSAGFFAYYAIWIDWNNDFAFDPITELVFESGQIFPAAATATITVPVATPVGSYRMRIVQDLFIGPDPCNGAIFGEYEDYTIETIAAPTCKEVTDILVTDISPNVVDVVFTDINTTAPSAGWDWEVTEVGSPTVIGSGNVSSPLITITGLTPGTDYSVSIIADCTTFLTDESLAAVKTFTTASGVALPWLEDFENAGAIPVTFSESGGEPWLFLDNPLSLAFTHIGNAGVINNATPSGGYFAVIDDSGNDFPSTLTSPFIDISSLTTPVLSFYEVSDNEGFLNATLEVEVFDGLVWNNVGTYNTNTNDWLERRILLNNLTFTGFARVRFTITDSGEFYDDIAIDDITFIELPCAGSILTWNGATWDGGVPAAVPTSSDYAIIDVDYNTLTFGDIDACSIEINTAAVLTVSAAGYVKTEGDILVNGSLVVENTGSVVQVDNDSKVIKAGSIEVTKQTPVMAAQSFMISGSPMTGETREGVFGAGYIVRNHVTANFIPNSVVATDFPMANNFADDNGDNWVTHTGGLNPGEGYLVFPQPDGASSGDYTQTHSLGTLNSGIVDFVMGFNADQNSSPSVLSNPYASAIDAELFFDNPANAGIDVVFFWEHLTAASVGYPGYSIANFDMGDLSLYSESLSAGVSAANGGSVPTQFISSGQGFGVKPLGAATAQFNNAMRVTGPNDSYRGNAGSKDRVWIRVHNDTYSLGSTALIGFTENTVDGYNKSEDVDRLPTPISLYSELETGEELVVNALGTFELSDAFYLSFSTQVKEIQDYRISIQDLDGPNLENATVYLIDNFTGSVTNLTEGDYTFESNEAIYSKRFKVVFENGALGINDSILESVSLYPNPTANRVTIVSPKIIVTSATIYDISGRKVSEVDFRNTANYQVDFTNLEAAVYFVSIITENGMLNKRVIKRN
jgi:hypothetical protein